MKTLTKFIIFSFAMILIFTVAVVVLKVITGEDFSSEYTVFCGIFGGEVLSCALIKLMKIKRE